MSNSELSKECFLQIAEMYGLDFRDPHMMELHTWVNNVIKDLEKLDELDLTDVKLDLSYSMGQEE